MQIFLKIEHVLVISTFNLDYEFILYSLNCIYKMCQEVPLYNEFVICFSYFFIVILTNNVFP